LADFVSGCFDLKRLLLTIAAKNIATAVPQIPKLQVVDYSWLSAIQAGQFCPTSLAAFQ